MLLQNFKHVQQNNIWVINMQYSWTNYVFTDNGMFHPKKQNSCLPTQAPLHWSNLLFSAPDFHVFALAAIFYQLGNF